MVHVAQRTGIADGWEFEIGLIELLSDFLIKIIVKNTEVGFLFISSNRCTMKLPLDCSIVQRLLPMQCSSNTFSDSFSNPEFILFSFHQIYNKKVKGNEISGKILNADAVEHMSKLHITVTMIYHNGTLVDIKELRNRGSPKSKKISECR